jgi:hypothetical protein
MYKDFLSDIKLIQLAFRDPQQHLYTPFAAETSEQYNALDSGRAGGFIAPIESLLFLQQMNQDSTTISSNQLQEESTPHMHVHSYIPAVYCSWMHCTSSMYLRS